MRTVGQAKKYVAEMLHEKETDPVLSTTVFSRWVSGERDRILSYRDWHWNRRTTPNNAVVWPAAGAGQEASILYLPHYMDQLLSVYPGSQFGISSVVIITPTEIDGWRPVAGRDVGRDYLVLHGKYGVKADMPAAGVVTITSSAGAGNQIVKVEGLDINQNEQSEEITVAGGGVQAGTTVFAAGPTGVSRVSLIGDGTGVPVTTTGIITATSGGVELERIDSSFEVAHECWRSELYATSISGGAYTVRYIRKHNYLLRDQDVIELPEYFHSVLETGLLQRLAQFRKQPDEVGMYKAQWHELMRELLAHDRRAPGKKYGIRIRRQHGRRRPL